MINSLLLNLRYAVRTLARSPGFTIMVVLTLALAIGANSTVFSAIDAILLRPLPFPNSDRIVRLYEIREGERMSLAPVRLLDWDRMNSTFDAIGGYFTNDVVDTTGDLPERLRNAVVTPRFFDVLGLPPLLGRGFTDEEHIFGGPRAVLVSDHVWRSRGADPELIGSQIRSGGNTVLIAGIMPEFPFIASDVDTWGPFPVDAPFAQSRGMAWLRTIGRLKPGVTIEQARADLAVVQSQLAEQYPGTDRGIDVYIEPLKTNMVGEASGSLWILFGAVSVLLLIACTNIASLLLSRAARREQEIAIRYSLGASRRTVIIQMLTESLVVSCAGALLGLLIAMSAVSVFQYLAPDLPRVGEITIDARILFYTVASAVVVALLCGLYPAMRCAREADVLNRSGRGQVSTNHRLQWLLVGVQVALSVTLLAGAGLLVRSFNALSGVDPGFEPSGVLVFQVTGRFGEDADYNRVVERINHTLDELEALPGIESAASTSELPGIPGQRLEEFELVGGNSADVPMLAESRIVSPGYFETLQIPLLDGELCSRPPGAEGTTQVMVNRDFADTYFPDRSAIGLQLSAGTPDRIMGIVGDAREGGIDSEPVPTVYHCFSASNPSPWYLVRTRIDPLAMVNTVRSRLAELEPQRPVHDVSALDQRIGGAYAENRLRTLLLVLFSTTAMLLACLGIYGTLSYVVSLRRREVGLRMALGAVQKNIIAQFLLRVFRVVGFAVAAGLVLAYFFTRMLTDMLYGVTPTDPLTLTGVVVMVMFVALLAAMFPALRASRVDPMQALREE